MAQHSGYPQITNERLDSLYKTYTDADNMAAERDYANEHFNECAKAAHGNYNRAKREADAAKAKPKPQFSFTGRGKPQPASPEWAAYERHLHIDYNDTIASFLAGTR